MDGPTRSIDGTRTTDEPPAQRLASSGPLDDGRFAPGTLLGSRYRIVSLLGRGGMGEVYRAEDLTLGQPVALKFLPRTVERGPEQRERMLDEIRTARKISHPNVCRVYDVAEVDGRQFLTMEYVDGEDLASLLRRIGRLAPDKGVEIAQQICAGLAASHDGGVLHRDLKPANILLDGRGRVRITDFGLGAAIDEVAAGGEIAGTPAYMAPEQLSGATLSVQTDLYALGLVLFELFTGQRMHDVTSTIELRDRHRQSGAAKLTSASSPLDPAVERVIERCLDPDPKRRPGSARAVAAALPGGDPLAAALAAGETPSPQLVADAGSAGRLSPAIAVPLVVVLLAGVALAALLQNDATYTGHVAFPHPPVVLASKAQEILARLGYDDPPGYTAHGFRADDDYIAWQLSRNPTPDAFDVLPLLRPPLVTFWRRASPVPMVPISYSGPFGGMAVRPSDPARDVSGMSFVELDPSGRLVSLEVIPPQVEPLDAPPAAAPDWSRLFDEAGLNQAQFTPDAPRWTGPYADARAAWTGPAPGIPGETLRVEASAYRGRPVMFRLVAPWTRAERMEPPPSTASRSAVWPQLVLMTSCLLVSIALARANVRRGRGDRAGAVRLAFAAGGASFAGALLTTDHVSAPEELLLLVKSAALALFIAGWMAVFYLALEPYVRRRWPHILISLIRLLSGRWRDPLVGRDLLIGSAVGVCLMCVELSQRTLSRWRGVLPRPPHATNVWEGTLGPAEAIGTLLHLLPDSIFVAMMWLALMFIFRVALRNAFVAAAVFVVMASAILGLTTPGDPATAMVVTAIQFSVIVTVLMRVGFLATMAIVLATRIAIAGWVSFAYAEFHPGTVAWWTAVALAPGLYGFYISLAGRPVLPRRFLEE